MHLRCIWVAYSYSSGTIFAQWKLNISKLVWTISMEVSAHSLIPLFVTSSTLASWFSLASYNIFIILATNIPDLKTNFWISWSLRSTDFVCGKFCFIYYYLFIFFFLKAPRRRYCKFFSSFFLNGGSPLLSYSWGKSHNKSSSSLFFPLSLGFLPVESIVFLFWQSGSVWQSVAV